LGRIKHIILSWFYISGYNYAIHDTNKMVKYSKNPGSLHVCILQAVSDSQILVFYRAKKHVKFNGTATNWNSAGYFNLEVKGCK
jgi:hypothetical protein